MQRLFDIVLAGLALLVLSPLLMPVALILRFTGEGEIFFRQSRIGRDGKPFELFKFATMLKNSPNIGTGTVTVRHDPRILPIGRLLRKTKINELPQLLNILNGDMSIIGPRPQTRRCFDAFPASTQKIIVQVPPGLSGIGSIVFRDEEELMHGNEKAADFYDCVIMPYKARLEQWYVGNRDLRTYFALIAVTVWVVLFPKSPALWRFYRDLPKPPAELEKQLLFSEKT
jgi:lipopolysaccharide/colanic/teichoic acid biosynthesis glycosyltransferase